LSRTLSILLACIAVICGIAALVGGVAYSFLNSSASDSQEVAVFEVRPGDSFKAAARRLEEAGLLKSAQKFELYGRFSGIGKKMKVGEYAIRRNSTPLEIASVIVSGRSIEYVITVTEGFNRFEIADLLEKHAIADRKEFLALTREPAFIHSLLGEDIESLEGYLFPETYHVTKFTGARGLVRMMVERFKENFAKITLPVNPRTGEKMTRQELVTLASIIEKETGAPEERPLISSVFHNRMKIKMRLQTDPTVIYGVWEKSGSWNRNISRADLTTPTRYNTYVFEGLPFGPISNPGFEAIKAASQPAQSEFLFFVSRNDGTHIFSKDFGAHQKAVARFQLDRKAREGKSWRDLQKRKQAGSAASGAEKQKPQEAKSR
jgi:UPF0755 protein